MKDKKFWWWYKKLGIIQKIKDKDDNIRDCKLSKRFYQEIMSKLGICWDHIEFDNIKVRPCQDHM